MVTKKEIFITSDGQEFEQEDNAILRERILEKHRKINATQKALKKLKEGCTHGKVTSLLKDSVVITCGKYQGITRYGKDLIKFERSF